jgi:hypothetical protein
MRRLLAICSLLTFLVPAARADVPGFAFEGLLPLIFQMRQPMPPNAYTVDGTVLTAEQIAHTFAIELGDPLVLIRDGEVVGRGTIGEIVAKKRAEALNGRMIFLRPAGLPDGVDAPAEPVGPAALLDAGYDLYVLTDLPVEVLAPDPAYTDITWGVHDYCVRVGRQRFAVIREFWPRTEEFRGWQVIKFDEAGNWKVTSDNTFQPQPR